MYNAYIKCREAPEECGAGGHTKVSCQKIIDEYQSYINMTKEMPESE